MKDQLLEWCMEYLSHSSPTKNNENTGKNPKIISELWKIPKTEAEQIGYNLLKRNC